MMKIKERADAIVAALEQAYPDAVCSLESRNALELLIATRLSAQCTDARVNIVTEAMFSKLRTVDDYADAQVSEIEGYIHSCGLYKTKARDIVKMAKVLREEYGGVVPDTIEELVKLPGVGRKTANLIVGDIYGKPSVVVDTHCIRITGRLALVDSNDPLKIERQLRALLDPEKSGMFCHRLVFHGRSVCKARAPECGNCCLRALCPYEG